MNDTLITETRLNAVVEHIQGRGVSMSAESLFTSLLTNLRKDSKGSEVSSQS